MANKARIGIPVNLPTGASHDILLVQTPDGYPEGKVVFGLSDTPRKITGIQKVAQMFFKVLLTRKGSDVINKGFGTFFSDYTINANRTGVDQDLYVAIIAEVKDAESQCTMILNTVDSDAASRIESITVAGLDVAQEAVVLYVKLVTQAGELASVAVPFPELDMKISQV